MNQNTQIASAFVDGNGLDFNQASRCAEALARETGAVALVTYWKDRPEETFELRVAAAHDGISTFAGVGVLDVRNQRFQPAPPIRYVPGQFGDTVHDVIKAAAESLPGTLKPQDFRNPEPSHLKVLLTDALRTLARETLAAA